MSAPAFGWCLRSPSGRLVPTTFSVDRNEAWSLAYAHLCHFKWMKPYWKRLKPSQIAAAKRGWKVVRVTLVITNFEDRP